MKNDEYAFVDYQKIIMSLRSVARRNQFLPLAVLYSIVQYIGISCILYYSWPTLLVLVLWTIVLLTNITGSGTVWVDIPFGRWELTWKQYQRCIIVWSGGHPEIMEVGNQWFSICLMRVVSLGRKSLIKCLSSRIKFKIGSCCCTVGTLYRNNE